MVINLRKILLVLGLFCLLITLGIGGDFIVSDIIETSSSNRLLPIYSVETPAKKVALTFDCAWGADDIQDIINVLEVNDVEATFFTVGDWVKKYPDAVKALHEAGMEIRQSFWFSCTCK